MTMLFNGASVAQVLVGDCLASLRTLPDQSAHMCVTSPPYYGLRDYGHEGQIGLEETPDAYVARLVEVFREVRRVLRDDGTLWLNIGDSYANTNKGHNSNGFGKLTGANLKNKGGFEPNRYTPIPDGLKQKDLIGVPWMLAFALRADGWYLRQDIIWHKPNPMPESVRDRCTKAHEYVFLLSKSDRYFYDHEAIKEPAVCGSNPPGNKSHRGAIEYENGDGKRRTTAGLAAYAAKVRESKKRGEFNGKTEALDGRNAFRAITETRNKRSVWTVAPKPYSGAHFAVYPPELIEPCILAGCPAGGVVLDPFGGSGTTAGVALAHGRNAILCELNPEYAALMPDRAKYIIDRSVKNDYHAEIIDETQKKVA